MKVRFLCMTMTALWIIGAVTMGWVFIRGWTMPSADARTEILLAPAEREQILGEMRQLLRAVHRVLTALSDPEQSMKEAEQAARAVGMSMAADASPSIMMKLPLPFKQIGMSVHRDFDGLADGIAGGENTAQILGRLSSITNRCTTCHDIYRFSDRR